MAETMGFVVPTGQVQAGPCVTKPYVAEGAITPTNLVKLGTADYQVVVNTAGSKAIAGVADCNWLARADGEDPLTHAYAAGEIVDVIIRGLCVVVADTSAITAGSLVQVGAADGKEVDDYADTAANAGDTYLTANTEAIKDELGLIIGRAKSDAASTVKAVIDLGAR